MLGKMTKESGSQGRPGRVIEVVFRGKNYIVSSPAEEYWEAQIHSKVGAEEILYIDFNGDEVQPDIIFGLHSRGIECRNSWIEGCGPSSWWKRLKAKSEMAELTFCKAVDAIRSAA